MALDSLEKAQAREQMRLSESILEPIYVHSVNDVKRVIAPLDPVRNPVAKEIPLSAIVNVGGDRYQVTAPTKSRSKRDILIEGLEIVRRRIENAGELDRGEAVEINGKRMMPAHVGDNINGSMWVDKFIKHWLGGYRNGVFICWDLDGYTYKYNIFEHRLTRIHIAAAS